MRWLIKTKDEKAWEAMVEFRDTFEKVYSEEMNKFRYKIFQKFMPKLIPYLEKNEDGIIFGLPISVPEMDFLKKILGKFGIHFEPKWKEKTTKQLAEYLMFKGVVFESVEYIGD